jgi:hypothetical protein
MWSSVLYDALLNAIQLLLSGPLKKMLWGQKFSLHAEVEKTVQEHFKAQLRTFYSDGIRKLVDC